ncbi:hypothetical protein DSO57_1022672 [Entomophthora muscae]|uniref:Uncharacterized protein n=1 Tax=Entomophthora muscae TaxID=34485 RepID=A0ACC2SS03_9FUNG|nr:hypothetical protein DSO57_1022672 [Entomophthora muscae]
MNLFTFFAVLTAYLGFGGHQFNSNQYGPMLDNISNMYYVEQPQITSSYTQPWSLLEPSNLTTSIAVYTGKYIKSSYLADLTPCTMGLYRSSVAEPKDLQEQPKTMTVV